MNNKSERALGDPGTDPDNGGESQELDESLLVDTTVTPVADDFDLDAWLAGVRPTRRSVKLYPHAHLVARMEQIADTIEAAPKTQDVDDLIDEFEQLKTQFRDGIWFTLEKRSSEWQHRWRKDLCKRLNLREDKDEDLAIIVLHQIAEQIVSPPGVTYNQLRTLRETNEGECNKLMFTLTAVNQVVAEKAAVLDRDFSGRRSATTPD